MKTSKGVKIAKMWDELEEKDNWDEFEKYLKTCSESDLREACINNKNMLINICFSFYWNPGFEYVSEDFIKQMFVDLPKQDKQYLEEMIAEDIYLIADDIYKDNKNTLKYFGHNANYIFKVGNYIKYCNPINEKIEKQYWFIMEEGVYYMNTKRIYE